MPLEKSNLYKLKILDSKESKTTFSKLFGPLAEAIQTGSNPCVFGPKPSIENYLVETIDGNTYLNANLMRNQMSGMLYHLQSNGWEEIDFSDSGAARTFFCKASYWFSTYQNHLSKFGEFILPDVKLDYVPQFVIPYEYLPGKLCHWMNRDSKLLESSIKKKIMARGGVAVAKSLDGQHDQSNTLWRISISPMDIFKHSKVRDNQILDVLVILKDLRIVAMSRFSKKMFSSYHIKIALLWCLEERSILSKQQLLDLTLKKLSSSYEQIFLPDFFDETCNLIGHVKKDMAAEIVTSIKSVRKKIHYWLTECQLKQAAFKLSFSDKISHYGFLGTHFLKLVLVLTKKSPSPIKYILWKLWTRQLEQHGWQNHDSVSPGALDHMKKDKQLNILCNKMISSVFDLTLNLIKRR